MTAADAGTGGSGRFADASVRDVLESLAAKTPTPGGGAAAALAAAVAAALAQMVISYSLGKKSLADHAALHHRAQQSLAAMRQHALDLVEADADAYRALSDLLKLAEDDPRRRRDMPAAVQKAIAAPDAVLTLAGELLDLLQQMCGTTNPNLRSDVAVAAILAEGAARAAACNVAINLPQLADHAQRLSISSRLTDAERRVREAAQAVEIACR